MSVPSLTDFGGDTAQQVARSLIDRYFKTSSYPYTRHHINSYDQFLRKDMPAIIRAQNPVLLLKDLIDDKDNTYRYKVEIFIGGEDGSHIEIGTPTVSLQNTEEVRILFPNEARLRNLTYASTVYADILVKITYTELATRDTPQILTPPIFEKYPLFKIPIMLHSSYCVLHNKPSEFLRQAGECPQDHGGYFVVGGSEKVLVTIQEQAFNTLYITPQNVDPKVKIFSSISCLHPQTRIVKRVAIAYLRREETIQVALPFVRKSIPLFVLFRALGFQSDEEILRLIYPDFETPEAKLMLPKLQPTIIDGYPFTNTHTAINYIKTLTKGFGVVHVLDIIRNQMFIHMSNDPTTQALFLADCVRKILRVNEGFDSKTDRDDTRNQRCLTSGFLVQQLFSNSYKVWRKAFTLAIDREYEANKGALYRGANFRNIFQPGNAAKIFAQGMLTDSIMRGFKGKWGTGLGEDKAGVLQALSRLSYCDFISHCRRVILQFDTTMKDTGPRKLHPSQYGYFCTNETPSGGSIGITKNLSVLAGISTAAELPEFKLWLNTKGRVSQPQDLTNEQRAIFVPVYINNGLFGYTAKPQLLNLTLKAFKRSGCLPYSVSITFSIRERRVQIFMDEGRPLRPLIWIGEGYIDKIKTLPTWRDLIIGRLPARAQTGLDATDFFDPLDKSKILEDYIGALKPYTGAIEYVDPYEQNESYIANYPEYINPETTHMEVHPSTILSIMTSLIPFPHHNQSPRNQLSCSQSKQGISMYTTNWQNRFDNMAHVICYGEAPLSRTIYTNYLGEGRMPYGSNIILAIACWTGYNQEDGIVMNYDALQRGLFRTIAYRSYSAFEEDDDLAHTKTRFGNPATIPAWKDLRPGLNYSKLDERGIIREGEYCDENTVIVGSYMTSELGTIKDASVTPQVWTTGRVEKIAITVNNSGLRLIKIRIVQDRIPELGDKFSNRHGQKGTIGALLRGHDMPRTNNGIVPDMIMNPHAIPSRMTIAQNLEQILGKAAAAGGSVGDGTAFMNDGSPEDQIGTLLEASGYEKYGNEILYNGATGEQIPAVIFVGPVYGMRLKHMVEDKWQARGMGRKEQRTHQPTGGRGNQGGLKIGEMDRDAIIGHSITSFYRESYMQRSDGSTMPLCTSCGTLPIYNPRLGISICTLCQGPARFVGDRAANLEILPSLTRQKGRIVNVEIPYATKVLQQELETFMNISMRFITTADTQHLRSFELSATSTEALAEFPNLILPPSIVPDETSPLPVQTVRLDDLIAMGAAVSSLIVKGNDEVTDTEIETEDHNELNRTYLASTGVPQLNANMMIEGAREAGISDLRAHLMQQQGQQEQQVDMDSQGEQYMPPDTSDMPPLIFGEEDSVPNTRQIGGAVYQQQSQIQSPIQPILASPMPGGGVTLCIDTSPAAMMNEGFQGGGIMRQQRQRPLRMNKFQGDGQPQQSQTYQAHSNAPITVNKMG